MDRQLDNKIALITGASSGIGRAAALLFAREGARLVLADVDVTGGEETGQMVTDKGGEAIFVRTDVSQAAQVEALVQRAVGEYGRLDCAFNNAGIAGLPVRMAEVPEDDFDRIMAVNVKGVWLCMKHEIPQMMAQGGGAIVNTASVAGLVGSHSLPIYGASKHAVVGMSKTAAVEYARKNIRVNCVCPAVIRTPMATGGLGEHSPFLDAAIAANPSRRLGEASEVAAAVLWLCSDAASFTTGAALTVDGGFTAQ